MQADRSAALPVRHYHASGRRRAQDWHHQQRLRHGVRGGGRETGPGVRLCRLRPVRIRLSSLPGRAADDRRVRGFLTQGLARQDRLPQSQSAETRKGSGRTGRGDRRRHRVRPAGLGAGGGVQGGSRRTYHSGLLAPLLGVAGSLALMTGAHAGSARDYLNAPVDTWLAIYNAGYTSAVTPEDGDDLVPGARSNVFAQSLVLTRIMDYWGRTGGVSIVLPYAFLDTSAGPFQASANGASDIGFLWQMNIFGGPALTLSEFQSFIPQTFSSFHLLVTTPLGTYDPTSPINPSANRWMVSPTVNFSYTPDEGWSWVETYVSGRIFSDNSNYLVNGAQTLTQKPILRLEERVRAARGRRRRGGEGGGRSTGGGGGAAQGSGNAEGARRPQPAAQATACARRREAAMKPSVAGGSSAP